MNTNLIQFGTRFSLSMIMLLALGQSVWVQSATGQTFKERPGNYNNVPDAAKDIGVDPKLGDFLDPEFTFHDEENNYVRLGDFFDGKRPIVLSFNYSNCPKLCEVQLEHMSLALREVDFKVGDDFQIISVSIDPKEQLARARAMRDRYSKVYNRPGSEESWHFLIGDDDMVKGLAKECGVRYKYVKRQKLYSHPPVFLLISPKGKIVRYIHGIKYEPVTISRALIEAAEGKIGSPINRLSFVTGCFLFDESTGKYSFAAMGLMRIAGFFTVFCLAIGIVPYWWIKKSRVGKEIETDDKTESEQEYKEVFRDEL